MRVVIGLLILISLAGCSPKVITKEIPIEVRVPVPAPCVQGDRPAEPESLRDRMSREMWTNLTTDQRENLLAAQALDRKAYGDRLTAATAGCD